MSTIIDEPSGKRDQQEQLSVQHRGRHQRMVARFLAVSSAATPSGSSPLSEVTAQARAGTATTTAGTWTVQQHDLTRGIYVDRLTTDNVVEAHAMFQRGPDFRVLDNSLNDFAADYENGRPIYHGRSQFHTELQRELQADLDVLPATAAPVVERLATVLKRLCAVASEAGLSDSEPELAAAHTLLQELQHARAAKPAVAGVEGHSAGPWFGEFYQADHGASLAICTKDHGVIALIPFANMDHAEVTDPHAIDGESAPREAFDLPNLRRLLACVNACEGMSTSMLEALRPDVQPFVDDVGRNFVVFSHHEFEQGGGAGFWSNEHGWVALEDATRFTQADTRTLGYPPPSTKSPDGCSEASWFDLASARAAVSRLQVAYEAEGMRP